MLPFQFDTATDESTALDAGADGARYLAGGTTLVDLMRQTVERPERVIDINGLPYRDIDLNSARLRVGALVRMSELAANPQVRLTARPSSLRTRAAPCSSELRRRRS